MNESCSIACIRTRRDVAVGAGDDGDGLVGARQRAGEAEVGDAGLHVGVQEDVVGLDVAVDHRRVAVVVEVGQPLRHAGGHVRDTQSASARFSGGPCSASHRLPLGMNSYSIIASLSLWMYPSSRTMFRCRSRPRSPTSLSTSGVSSDAAASPSVGAGRHSFFTATTARARGSSALYTTPVAPMPTVFASLMHASTSLLVNPTRWNAVSRHGHAPPASAPPPRFSSSYHRRYAYRPPRSAVNAATTASIPTSHPTATRFSRALMPRGRAATPVSRLPEHGGSTPPHSPALPASSSGLIERRTPFPGTGPVRLLYDRFSVSSAGELPKFSGMPPVRELLDRSRMAIAGIMASGLGISPLSRLRLRLSFTSLWHDARLDGIAPASRLFDTSSAASAGQSWNWSGSSPEMRLSDARKLCRVGIVNRLDGIEYWRRLRETSTNDSDADDARSPGISPDRSLPASSSRCSDGSLPNPTGIVPVSRLLCMRTRTSDEHDASPAGIPPVKPLLNIISLASALPSQIPAGTGPARELDDTSTHCNGELLPSDAGSGPLEHLQARHVADGRRHGAVEAVAHEDQQPEVAQLSYLVGDRAGEQVVGEVEEDERRDVAELRRYLAFEAVLVQVERGERRKPSELRWDGAVEVADGEVEVLEVGEVAELRRDASLERIVTDDEALEGLEHAELRWDLAGDVVAGEAQELELGEAPVSRRDVAAEKAAPEVDGLERRGVGEVGGERADEVVAGGVDGCQEPRPAGNAPSKEFWLTSNTWRLESGAKDLGSVVANALEERLRTVSDGSRSTSSETLPLRFLPERSRTSTTPAALHRTPVQPQCGAALAPSFQSASAPNESTKPALSASSAARSPPPPAAAPTPVYKMETDTVTSRTTSTRTLASIRIRMPDVC
ncbi:LOW QUALITY PROTEIN: hypothetical protein U9M48_025965 [Paspalum notatum var. saurae]|uniref:Uncharacterized protein n=1 Tax=Paspalum notatum var. saurae TaxID=547442 RepID=A0AAQ3WYI5_PASNO